MLVVTRAKELQVGLTDARAFSPGKIIFLGVHGVVYGCPAILAAIDNGIWVELSIKKPIEAKDNEPAENLADYLSKDAYAAHIFNEWQKMSGCDVETIAALKKLFIKIESNLPQNSGLGSSAAFANALVQALSQAARLRLTQMKRFNLVWQCENFKHGNSSGGDPAAVVWGGVILYRRGKTTLPVAPGLMSKIASIDWWLIQTGKAVESTKEMVELVAAHPRRAELINKIDRIMDEVRTPRADLVEIIKRKEQVLEELGVVSKTAKKIIDKIYEHGGVAELIGAGGIKKGSGYILAGNINEDFIKKLGLDYQKITFQQGA